MKGIIEVTRITAATFLAAGSVLNVIYGPQTYESYFEEQVTPEIIICFDIDGVGRIPLEEEQFDE
ncbi:hypothetical protein [endosymbiont GvMRE of Glomus versiforme]|uniref:hypothetical protein n=1 Tax=endosymbiont GvMRE of Glomus versiforme TaxID=2039283 RepID=UPI000ECDAA36|nr:hypothetical protein [endosymbiont GvMRE of Glomus versiforme]RHZ35185.1 hypothetical protein GvMRE_IIg58 [endosymbiont GvMRE of Glomus versiforme]